MKLPSNGVAKELRHYVGSLFIFLFVIGIIVVLIQFPVLDTNKEVVMMLIGTISASIGIVVSTITGAQTRRCDGFKNVIRKKRTPYRALGVCKRPIRANGYKSAEADVRKSRCSYG